jgi:DNA polymerase III subunit delta
MKLTVDKLSQQLNKSLAPIYIVSGDETLLVEETSQLIQDAAIKKGFTEREIYYITPQFDWNQLLATANNLSLFAEQSLIELRIPTGKVNDAGKKALKEYAGNPPANKILLIISGKLETSTQNTKWFKTIEQAGIFAPIWPITTAQLPYWLKDRLNKEGLTATPDALQFLTERTDGNLLAARQEIEKLSLLYDKKQLTLDEIINAISDSARYNIFVLADTILGGNAKRALSILAHLKAEGTEPTIILWALTREIRTLVNMAEIAKQGLPIDQILAQQKVWEKRKPFYRLALKRSNLNKLLKLLKNAGVVDRIIKGVEPDNVWDKLNQLTLGLAR